jgi:tRNA(Leu) C34 or U34 (ribose-2'-O)-methylase TrmL
MYTLKSRLCCALHEHRIRITSDSSVGIELDDKRARRAGLDYHELARMKDYPTLQDHLDAKKPLRIFAMTTKGQRPYYDVAFQPGDALYCGTASWPAVARCCRSAQSV